MHRIAPYPRIRNIDLPDPYLNDQQNLPDPCPDPNNQQSDHTHPQPAFPMRPIASNILAGDFIISLGNWARRPIAAAY